MVRKLLVPLLFLPILGIAQIQFVELAEQAGLSEATGVYGVAIADFDNDGFEDMLITRENNPNLLYRNNGNNTFLLAKEQFDTGFEIESKAAVWGDMDNDGDQDLFLGANKGEHRFFENQGDGTFEDISNIAGVNTFGKCTTVNLADFNNDGLLDIYVSNFEAENNLFVNQGDNVFSDQILISGAGYDGASMSSIAVDIDKDGDQDLYLVHHANAANRLLLNDGAATFTDVSDQSGAVNILSQGIGVNLGDYNNDGHFDLYVSNMHANVLLSGTDNGLFENDSDIAQVANEDIGWGMEFLDYDNDGWEDIYLANNNGFSEGENVLYRNLADGTFEVVSDNSILSSTLSGMSVAQFDGDKNGLIDLVVGNNALDDAIEYFINEEVLANYWLQIKLEGVNSNRDAIGTRIEFSDADGNIRMKTVTAGSGFASQSSKVIHFGLGINPEIEELMIYWPNGLVESITTPPVNRRLEIREGQGIVNGLDNPANSDGFSVGPNPTEQDWHVRFNLAESRNVQLRLFDTSGRLLQDHGVQRYPAGAYDELLSIPSKGMFVANLIVDGEAFSWRITKL